MISDYEIADLCYRIYQPDGEEAVPWNFFEPGAGADGVCYGIWRDADGIDNVVLRGSKLLLDWRRDGDWWSRPKLDPRLGAVWPGFAAGMADAWTEINRRVGAKVRLAGHSLGAARCSLLAGLMKLDGCKPVARVVFGEPFPGMQQLASLIEDVPGWSYRNGDLVHHDPITDLPYRLPLLNWQRASPLIPVTAPPDKVATDMLGEFFAWHHMGLYRQAMKTLVPPGAD